MDMVWFSRFRRGGGQLGLLDWETGTGIHTWDDVSDPGRVGERLIKGFTGRAPSDRWARTLNNLVHWTTGAAWGAQFGLLCRSSGRRRWTLSLLLGPTVWLTSYLVLPLAKIYKPLWKYDAETLARDFTAHLMYGSVTAATFAALTR
jgi:hypothetical protein